jgi:hypothetical protein
VASREEGHEMSHQQSEILYDDQEDMTPFAFINKDNY